MEQSVTPKRGRPRGFDRDEALRRALELFRQRGYDGTTVAELCAATGLNPPSLYAAFGDKRRLWAEALDRYQSEQGRFGADALAQAPTAREAIRRLLFEAAGALAEPCGPKGCVVVIGALASPDAGACADASERRLRVGTAVRDRLVAAREAGELPAGTDVDALARFFVSVFQGMAIQARDGASRTDLEAVAALAMAAWPQAQEA